MTTIVAILIISAVFGNWYADFARKDHPVPQAKQAWWVAGGMVATGIFTAAAIVFNPNQDPITTTLLIALVFLLSFGPQIPTQRAINAFDKDNSLISKMKRSE